MANAYLDLLADKAKTAGMVNAEISYKEAWKFHNFVFEKNGLRPSTWTLDTPLSIIEENGGPAAAQKYWESLLKRGQDPVAGTIDSIATQTWMAQIATYGATPELREQAKAWLEAVPNVASPLVTAEMLARLVIDGYVSPSLVNLSQMMKDFGVPLIERLKDALPEKLLNLISERETGHSYGEFVLVRHQMDDSYQWGFDSNGTVSRGLEHGITETRILDGEGKPGEGILLNRDGSLLRTLNASEKVCLTDSGWVIQDGSGKLKSLSLAVRDLSDSSSSIQYQLERHTTLVLSDRQREELGRFFSAFDDPSIHELPDGTVVILDPQGKALGTLGRDSDGAIRYVNDAKQGIEVDVDGRVEQVTEGLTASQMLSRQQAQQLQSGLGAVQSALSLIQALEQGNTFSAALAGVSMMNQIIAASGGNLPPELASMVGPMRDIGAGLGAVSAAMNLAEAIKQGDAMGILQSSANLGSQGIHLYAAMEGLELVDKAGNATGALGSAAQGLGAVAAGVGLVMAIESGNPVSIATSALSLMSSIGMINPYIGVAIAIYSLVSSLFSNSDQPMLEGQAQAIWDESGTTHVITTQNSHNGGATATSWMNNLVSGLQAQLAGIVDAHGQPVYGLITPRLPSLGYQYDPDGFNYSDGAKGHLYLKWIDENGQEQTRYYDGAGNRSDGTGDTLVGDFMKRALQAVVPSWEAETVRQHFLQEGSLAAAMPAHGAGMPVEDAQHVTQSFTALTFQAVATPGSDNPLIHADIDGDGYLEKTEWIAANQGLLSIDLNGDGRIGAGELLNLDPAATLQRNSLRWLDANQDGMLDARDPAFAVLKVWLDVNHDGVSQGVGESSTSELQDLAAAGITGIDFTGEVPLLVRADGVTVRLNAQHLTGDVKGVAYLMTPGGLLESQESGETVLRAINTRAFDGQKTHTHGGDLAQEGGRALIDVGNAALKSASERTINQSSQRIDTKIKADDRRLAGGDVGAVSAGQAATADAAARTVAAQVRSAPLAFLPGSATTPGQQLRQATQEMLRSADNSLFGLNSGNGAPLVAVAVAAAATQWPVVAGAAPQQALTQSTDMPGGTPIVESSPAEDVALANVQTVAVYGEQLIDQSRRASVALPESNAVVTLLLPVSSVSRGLVEHRPEESPAQAVSVTVNSVPVTVETTSESAVAARASRVRYAELVSTPISSAAVSAGLSLDYPTVLGEHIEGSEDIGLRLPETILLDNDVAINAAANSSQQPLRITAVFNPVHGQVFLRSSADGKSEVLFVPDQNYHGPASFRYTVTDQYGLSSQAMTSLVIAPVNDAPVVQSEVGQGDEDGTLILRTVDLLANDFDVDSTTDGDQLRITRVGQALHGRVILGEDGSIRYSPDADYHGPAQFTYWVGDRDTSELIRNGGVGNEIAGTVSLNIGAVNDVPVVRDESALSDEDRIMVFSVADLLANDSDVDAVSDGDVLRITRVGQAEHGQVSLGDDGEIRFAPDRDYNGPAQFTYWVGDRELGQLRGDGGEGFETPGTVHLTITPVNDAPVVFNEMAAGDEDNVLVFRAVDLLANDEDVDIATNGDVLRITRVGQAQHGQVSLSDEGMIRFTPDRDYNGPAQFTYWVGDREPGQLTANGGEGFETPGTVQLTIAPVNDAPVVFNEMAAGDEDNALLFRAIDLLANDEDVDIATNGDVLRITRVGQAQHGQVSLRDDGMIRFTPDRDYNGPAQFSYWVGDRDPAGLISHGGVGQEIIGTVSLSIRPINDAPVVRDESASGDEDRMLIFSAADLLANDSDVDAVSDGDVLRITRVGQAQHGQAFLGDDGNIRFVPDRDYNGPAQFAYWVGDREPGLLNANGGEGIETVGTVHLSILPVNDAPVVLNDQASGDEDNILMFRAADLLANDSDADSAINGDVLHIVRVGEAQHGQVSLGEDGTIRFSPDPDYNGPAQFRYWVSDLDPTLLAADGGNGVEVAGTMFLNILAVNDLPVVTGEQIDSAEDIVLEIAPSLLLANDTDLDIASNAQVLRISAVGNAQHGVVELLEDGKIRFVPERDYAGSASFSYLVDDGNGGRVWATTLIKLAPVNDAPDVAGETISFDEDVIQNIDPELLLVNDSDVDNAHEMLQIVSVDNATHGAVTLKPDGTIDFVPERDYFGRAAFTYTVADGSGGLTVGMALLQINPVNDAPRLKGETLSVDEDQIVHLDATTLLANDADIDNDHAQLQLKSVGRAVRGAVRLENGEIIFTPQLNYSGPASFSYVVEDGAGGRSEARVDLQFNAVNDAPVVNDEQLNGKRNLSYTLTKAALLANDSDVEDPQSLSIVGVRAATHGTVVLNANDTITFLPEVNYAGVGSFEYVVLDPDGAQSIGTVRIDFSRVNQNPVAIDDSFVGFEDTAFVIATAQLLVNDADPDATATSRLSVTAVGNSINGAVSLQGDGSVRFTPAQDYFGVASFRYLVSDGEGGSTWAIAYLNVQTVNDAPVIEDVWYGRPIYGYRWSEFGDAGYAWLEPVSDAQTALALASNPHDRVALADGSSRSNDLMDGAGNVIGLSFYRNGQPRPIAINTADAKEFDEESYSENVQDDIYRQNGKVIAYDPDGSSANLNFAVLAGPQHGHAWANEYTDTSAPPRFTHNHAPHYAIPEKAAWQYFSHYGDPYSGDDPFTIRVTDEQGAAVDAVIAAVHTGTTAGSGGGGKCPIIIDLDGDGIELVRPDASHMFADLNGDGWRERIGWASTDDGILAFDANKDGRISSDKEISFVSYKADARTDLDGLAAFDTDGDGKLTSLDDQWPAFGILRDMNRNGVQDPGEFVSLDEMGIASIGLQRQGIPEVNHGNVVFGTSEVAFVDGSRTLAGDVMFGGENSPFPDAVNELLDTVNSLRNPQPQSALRTASDPTGTTSHVAHVPISADASPSMDDMAAIRQMALLFNQMTAARLEPAEQGLTFLPSATDTIRLVSGEISTTSHDIVHEPSVDEVRALVSF